MKKKTWIILLLIFIAAIGGYILLRINQNNDNIKRIDNIPVKSSVNSTNTISMSEGSDGQLIDEPTPSTEPTSQPISKGEPLPSTSDKPGKTNGGGGVVSDGTWDYLYISRSKGDTGSLVKIKKDGSDYIKLSKAEASSINIIGEWIYYVGDNPKGIYRIRKDATNEEQIFNGDCGNMIAIGDTLYFINRSDDYSIYRIKTDGSNVELLIKNGAPMQYENGFLYYRMFSDIYRVNLSDFSQSEKVAENVQTYTVYKDSIYFYQYDQNRILYKKAIGTEDIKVLHDNISPYYVIQNNRIYFMTEERGSIYTMDLDGNDISELPRNKDIDIRRIHAVTEDMVYYWVICDDSESSADELYRMNFDGSINEKVYRD